MTASMKDKLLEDLLWFLNHPSVTGAEKDLCDDLEARIGGKSGWRIEISAELPSPPPVTLGWLRNQSRSSSSLSFMDAVIPAPRIA